MAETGAPPTVNIDDMTPEQIYAGLRIALGLDEAPFSDAGAQQVSEEIQKRLRANLAGVERPTGGQVQDATGKLVQDISTQMQNVGRTNMTPEVVGALFERAVPAMSALNVAPTLDPQELQTVLRVAQREGAEMTPNATNAARFALAAREQAMGLAQVLGAYFQQADPEKLSTFTPEKLLEAMKSGKLAETLKTGLEGITDRETFAAQTRVTVTDALKLVSVFGEIEAAGVYAFDKPVEPIRDAMIHPHPGDEAVDGKAAEIQAALANAGAKLGVNLLSGTVEERVAALDTRFPKIHDEFMADLKASGRRTRYPEHEFQKYFETTFGGSQEDVRTSLITQMQTLKDLAKLDANTVSAMATVRGVFPVFDLQPDASFSDNWGSMNTKMAALLNAFGDQGDLIDPATLDAATLKTKLDALANSSDFQKLEKACSLGRLEMAQRGLINQDKGPDGSSRGLFTDYMKAHPEALVALVQNRDALLAAYGVVGQNMAAIQAAPASQVAQPAAPAAGIIQTSTVQPVPAPSGSAAAAQPKPEAPSSNGTAGTTSAAGGTVTNDAAALQALGGTLVGLGLLPAGAGVQADGAYLAASTQLRDAIFIVGGNAFGTGAVVTEADIAEMERVVAEFKQGPDYKNFVALSKGEIPESLSADEKQEVQEIFSKHPNDRAAAMKEILQLKADFADPDDASKVMWAKIGQRAPSLQDHMPAVVALLESSDSLFTQMRAVYASGGASISAEAAAQAEKARQEQGAQADASADSQDVKAATRRVQKALGEVGDAFGGMADKISRFVDVSDIYTPPSAQEVADEKFGVTSNDALAKAMLALKVAAGAEGNVDGTYDPSLRRQIYINPQLAMVAQKLGVQQMSADEFKAYEKERVELLKIKGMTDKNAQNAALAAKGIASAQELDDRLKLNRLDQLFADMDLLQKNNAIDQKRGQELSKYNMMMDLAYDKFLSKTEIGQQIMHWLKDFLTDPNNKFGQMIMSGFAAFGIDIKRLWGDRSTSTPTQLADEAKPLLSEAYKIVIQNYDDIDVAKKTVRDWMDSPTVGVIGKMFKGLPKDELEKALLDGLDKAQAAGSDREAQAEAFANHLVAVGKAYQKDGKFEVTGSSPAEVDRAMKDEALSNPATPDEIKKALGGVAPGTPASQPAPAPAPAPSGAAGGITTLGPQDLGAGVTIEYAQVDNSEDWQFVYASMDAAPAAIVKDGGVITEPAVGVEKVDGADGKAYGLTFITDTRKYDPKPIVIAEKDVRSLASALQSVEGQIGMITQSPSYETAIQKGMITPNLSMALEELLIRAQLHEGVALDKLEHKFNDKNIALVETYLVDQKVDVAKAGAISGLLHSLDAKPDGVKASVLDRCMLRQIGVESWMVPEKKPDAAPAPVVAPVPVATGPKVNPEDQAIYDKYVAFNKNLNCPAPFVYRGDDGEIYAAIIDQHGTKDDLKDDEFRILKLEHFDETRGFDISDYSALRDNYAWPKSVPDAYSMRVYVERTLCLEPLAQKPAPAAEEKPAPAAVVIKDEPASAKRPEYYSDLPKLARDTSLNDGQLTVDWLDKLYQQAVNMGKPGGTRFGGISEGGFMLTKLSDEDKKALGADYVVTTRYGGEARGRIEHRLVNFEKHGIKLGAMNGETYNPDASERRLDDFLFRSRLHELHGLTGVNGDHYSTAQQVGSYDMMSHVVEVPRRDGGFPFINFDGLEVLYSQKSNPALERTVGAEYIKMNKAYHNSGGLNGADGRMAAIGAVMHAQGVGDERTLVELRGQWSAAAASTQAPASSGGAPAATPTAASVDQKQGGCDKPDDFRKFGFADRISYEFKRNGYRMDGMNPTEAADAAMEDMRRDCGVDGNDGVLPETAYPAPVSEATINWINR